jgi:hypothetical protein
MTEKKNEGMPPGAWLSYSQAQDYASLGRTTLTTLVTSGRVPPLITLVLFTGRLLLSLLTGRSLLFSLEGKYGTPFRAAHRQNHLGFPRGYYPGRGT